MSGSSWLTPARGRSEEDSTTALNPRFTRRTMATSMESSRRSTSSLKGLTNMPELHVCIVGNFISLEYPGNSGTFSGIWVL
jgi:hypothetical protein